MRLGLVPIAFHDDVDKAMKYSKKQSLSIYDG